MLGAILLDPGVFREVEVLPVQAFSISNHRQIFGVMRDLHSKNLQPDLPTVAFKMSELGILHSAGGKSKLASLLDRTVHSGSIKQYVRLLQEKYYRRYLSESFSRIAILAETEVDLGSTFQQAPAPRDEPMGEGRASYTTDYPKHTTDSPKSPALSHDGIGTPSTNSTKDSANNQIVEANGWTINNKGEVVLTATAPTSTLDIPWVPKSGCNAPEPKS